MILVFGCVALTSLLNFSASEVAGLLPGVAPPELFSFRPAARYLPNVPTPDALLGREIGAAFTPHAQLVRAVDAIAAASDRVQRVEYGRTNGGRPLLLLLVSSRENLQRRAEIAAELAELADPRRTSAERAAEIAASTPAVVWLSFSVHGNEPSGTEASLALLYHLAAADDDAVAAILRDTLIVLDPCLNPDGRERYVNWFASVVGRTPDPDPQAAEHDEPWPGGRSNHNYCDLNRDWAFLSQVETRARLAWYRQLIPQVHADLHEMSPESSYFFFPAAAPVNDNYPRALLDLGERFGEANAAAFDRHGWEYYTKESYDLFYPGYGDSWPSLNGAIGMTYEQAGHGRAGLAYRREDGTLLTLRERAAHHFTAALATVETAAARRAELLDYFWRFHADALWEGEHGPVRDFVLVPHPVDGRTDELVELLLDQGIEVRRARAAFAAEGCHSFGAAEGRRERFAEGTYVVSLAQPKKRLAKALLEPRAAVREAEFYDVSAWSLPLAYGVAAHWTEVPVEPALLDPVAEIAAPAGGVRGGSSSVGYLARFDASRAPRLLDRLLGAGVRVKCLTKRIALRDEEFGPGTLLVPAADNGERLPERLDAAAREFGVELVAAPTGLTREGPDLGSESVQTLHAPRVAIAGGSGTSATSFGQMRDLFAHKLGMAATVLPLESLGSADLRRYNVLILPDGFGYGELGSAGAEELKRWVEAGGTVIGIGGGAAYLTAGRSGLTSVKLAEAKEDEGAASRPWRPLSERREEMLERQLPGTLFRVRLDPSHPLAYGSAESLAVLVDSLRAFEVDASATFLGVFERGAWLSGFTSEETAKKLEGKACLADAAVGRGHALLFASDPVFRGLMRGQQQLLVNAVFLFARAPVR